MPLSAALVSQKMIKNFGAMQAMPVNIRILYFAKHCAEPYVEIVTVTETKRCQSVCSSEDEEPEDLLPVLTDHSELLEDSHIQRLGSHLPARTQGYPWRLVYSTIMHGTSLKTLYRNLALVDSPVILVIKDMDKQVFGGFSSHPFRVSKRCYGTGETFLYSFSPELKVFHWSGANSYFVKGHRDCLQMGGGGGLFGLWLDADLSRGCSLACDTFHNQPLSTKRDFMIQDLEVWAFH
ncbi:nuclear receptor coactivator 7 [Anguilla anguilla]|uniref:nuclear receptor coactivator 7 n=1 Tax=Anguilla anguilla TaxID=7936 RepID=UPI0015AB1076|nr:nuclear receptor coactivator 7 [Anguilla anguilla]